MSKFVIVKTVPENLEKGCIVIPAPNFRDEVAKCERKRPKTKTMTPNYMREVLACIGDKYADEDFNALTSVNVSLYKGISCETQEQAHGVIIKALSEHYPRMLDLFVEYNLKRRPHGTRLIYFTGNFSQTSKFFEHGIDEVKEKDVLVHLGLKAKKIVGKPAITNEEAGNVV